MLAHRVGVELDPLTQLSDRQAAGGGSAERLGDSPARGMSERLGLVRGKAGSFATS